MNDFNQAKTILVREVKAYHKAEFEAEYKVGDSVTKLHLGASFGSSKIVKVLLDKGADVNAVNENQETALHLADKYGHVDVVKVLLQNAQM